MEYLEALEASGFSMWVKESSTAYVAVLAFHTIGLAFLVGISGATSMRILGIARSMPLAPMVEFFPLMYVGFWINAFTGGVLVCLYPTDYVSDPIVYIKLAAVVVALVLIRRLRAVVFDGGLDAESAANSGNTKMLAAGVIAFWLIATVCGRVIAYTLPTRLQTIAAVIVVALMAAVAGYLVARRPSGQDA